MMQHGQISHSDYEASQVLLDPTTSLDTSMNYLQVSASDEQTINVGIDLFQFISDSVMCWVVCRVLDTAVYMCLVGSGL